MPLMKKTTIYLASLFTFYASLCFGTEVTPLKRVENYFNTLSTFQAEFEQVIPGQDVASGMFYINRPRQFLWDYTQPHAQKLVSTGAQLFFYDKEAEQATQLPLNHGLAALFVQEPFTLSGDKFLVDAYAENDTHMNLTLKMKEPESEAESGRLSLIFKKSPMTLEKIITEDAFGSRIHLLFKNIKTGLPLQASLFEFTPPVDVWAD